MKKILLILLGIGFLQAQNNIVLDVCFYKQKYQLGDVAQKPFLVDTFYLQTFINGNDTIIKQDKLGGYPVHADLFLDGFHYSEPPYLQYDLIYFCIKQKWLSLLSKQR